MTRGIYNGGLTQLGCRWMSEERPRLSRMGVGAEMGGMDDGRTIK